MPTSEPLSTALGGTGFQVSPASGSASEPQNAVGPRATPVAQLRVQALHGRLHDLAVSGGDRAATVAAFLRLAGQAADSRMIAFAGRDAAGELVIECQEGPADIVPTEQVLACGRIACERGTIHSIAGPVDVVITAQPVACCGAAPTSNCSP